MRQWAALLFLFYSLIILVRKQIMQQNIKILGYNAIYDKMLLESIIFKNQSFKATCGQ